MNKHPVIRTVSSYNHSWSSPATSIPNTARIISTTTTSDITVINNPTYSKTTKVKKEKSAAWIKKGSTKIIQDDPPNIVTPHSSYRPSQESKVSGPNPGDFPIISLIDEPSVNYYEQVFQTPASSSSYITLHKETSAVC